MNNRRLVAMLVATLVSTQAATTASAISLADLETRLNNNPQVALSELEYRQRSAAVEEEQAKQGWKLYGSATVSDNDEIYAQGATRSYREVSGQVGLQYPLFGSRLRELEAVQDASTRQHIQAAEVELARISALKQLRLAYIGYWTSQQAAHATSSYLESERAVRTRLCSRVDAGLLLKSDYETLMSGYSYAHNRQVEFNTRRDTSLQKIRLLTLGAVEDFPAEAPSLPPLCNSPEALQDAVSQSHPELTALDQLVEEKAGNPRLDGAYSIDSNLQLSYSANHETTSGETGHSAMVGVSVKMPLAFLKTGSSAKDQAKADLEKAKLKRELREQELQLEAVETLNRYQALRAAVSHASRQLSAARNATRTQFLRVRSLPESRMEDFENARRQAFEAELSAIEAQGSMLKVAVELNALAPSGCKGEAPVVPEEVPPTRDQRVASSYEPGASSLLAKPTNPPDDRAALPSILDLAAPMAQAESQSANAATDNVRRHTPIPTPRARPDTPGLLKQGASGEAVVQLQTLLNRLFDAGITVDGEFGGSTVRALRTAQHHLGESADGVLGPETKRILLAMAESGTGQSPRPARAPDSPKKLSSPADPAANVSAADLTKRGARGEEVVRLQQALNQLFDARIPVDGQFGDSTVRALKQAQTLLGETPDGVYGPGTEEKLAAFAMYMTRNPASLVRKSVRERTAKLTSERVESVSRKLGWIEQ